MENEKYTMEVPVLEGKEGFVGVFFTLYLKLGGILQSPEFSKEPIRVHYMVSLISSLIPEPKVRLKIREGMRDIKDRLTKEYMQRNGITQLTPDQTNHILIESSLESLGYIQDYVDKMMGLATVNKIGFYIDDGKITIDDERIPTEAHGRDTINFETCKPGTA